MTDYPFRPHTPTSLRFLCVTSPNPDRWINRHRGRCKHENKQSFLATVALQFVLFARTPNTNHSFANEVHQRNLSAN
ncbi:hypothetical protein L596_013298 [Steinernema carpocapsae]|uniref:Uncharacterized protein n=1 Tax=Steinernema carpocapsae TaxID=34508 RepID=A0A4U5P0K8_STECR|nr:hypothetical protein L596_013298 [Steinernema carpocapsae]